MHKKIDGVQYYVLVFIVFFIVTISIYPDDSDNDTDWILASQKFSEVQNETESVLNDAVCQVLPKLILKNISLNLTRTIQHTEIVNRKLNQLKTERTALFLQLSDEIKQRDSLLLQNLNSKEMEKELAVETKKIEDIKKQINKNLEDYNSELQKQTSDKGMEMPVTDKAKGNHLFGFFSQKEKKEESASENVVLYKNDGSTLFSVSDSEDEIDTDYSSSEFQKAVLKEKISGLISGSVSSYGEYAQVSVTLHIFPGNEIAGTVTEIGLLSNLSDIAERISYLLIPKITNGLPSQLFFDINPPEALKSLRITVDNQVFTNIPEKVIVTGGIHSVSFVADNFVPKSGSYYFSGGKNYTVSILLQCRSSNYLTVQLPETFGGTVFADGIQTHAVSPELPSDYRIRVNDKPVMGSLVSTDGKFSFFYIPTENQTNNAKLAVKADSFDVTETVEHRRRMMYLAYSVLVSSLPVTFYFQGNFATAKNAYYLEYIDYDEAVSKQLYARIAAGISITAGIWYSYELIRYIISANKVLPERATKVEEK